VPLAGLAAVPASVAVVRARGARRAGAAVVAGASVALVAFFRDPDRVPGGGAVLAPADGVVMAVEQEADGRVRVATFMRLNDVHVNRAPMDGVVRERRHLAGGHRAAFRSESHRNERMEWTIETPLGELRLVQVAGWLARRIVPYRAPGDTVVRGQRLGMIRFGSRVDVILPPGVETCARAGDRVRAGVTRLDAGVDGGVA